MAWQSECVSCVEVLLPLVNSICSSAWHLAINFLLNSTIFQMILLMSVLQSCECWPICQADTNAFTQASRQAGRHTHTQGVPCVYTLHTCMHLLSSLLFFVRKATTAAAAPTIRLSTDKWCHCDYVAIVVWALFSWRLLVTEWVCVCMYFIFCLYINYCRFAPILDSQCHFRNEYMCLRLNDIEQWISKNEKNKNRRRTEKWRRSRSSRSEGKKHESKRKSVFSCSFSKATIHFNVSLEWFIKLLNLY